MFNVDPDNVIMAFPTEEKCCYFITDCIELNSMYEAEFYYVKVALTSHLYMCLYDVYILKM